MNFDCHKSEDVTPLPGPTPNRLCTPGAAVWARVGVIGQWSYPKFTQELGVLEVSFLGLQFDSTDSLPETSNGYTRLPHHVLSEEGVDMLLHFQPQYCQLRN